MSNWVLASYLRLSLDDDSDIESGSITAQRELIRHFVAGQSDLCGVENKEYVDDGYSGTNFDRPAMKRLLEDVRTGKINCIIVKDLSRFGREFIEVGKYLEVIFPSIGVRFISIGDRYDSNNFKGKTAGLDIAIRNLINSLYSKDVSKKVTSAKRTQMARAEFASSHAIYGYKKSAVKGKLEIDESAAVIVRHIFEMAQGGTSNKQIALTLNREGIPTPSEYKAKIGERNGWNTASNETHWKAAAVLRILKDERYIGTFIAGKTKAGKVGTKTHIRQDESEWVKRPGAIPAIIDVDVYEAVRAKIIRIRDTSKKRESSRLLYRKLKCSHCNHYLYYKDTGKEPYFYCDTPRYEANSKCFTGRLLQKDIHRAITDSIHGQMLLSEEMKKSAARERRNREAHIADLKQRLVLMGVSDTQIAEQKRELYEQYRSGAIRKAEYLRERELLSDENPGLLEDKEQLASEIAKEQSRLDDFIRESERICSFGSEETLSRELIDELIESFTVIDSEHIEIRFAYADSWRALSSNNF